MTKKQLNNFFFSLAKTHAHAQEANTECISDLNSALIKVARCLFFSHSWTFSRLAISLLNVKLSLNQTNMSWSNSMIHSVERAWEQWTGSESGRLTHEFWIFLVLLVSNEPLVFQEQYLTFTILLCSNWHSFVACNFRCVPCYVMYVY